MLVRDGERALEVVKTLSDECSRKIIISIISRSLTVEEIAKQQHIPMSTCYRRVHELLGRGMVRVDKTIISEEGKKFVCYIAAFKTASIRLESGELRVDVIVRDRPDRLQEILSSTKSSTPGVIELKTTTVPILHA